MAGVKGKSGGKRVNSGRKKKNTPKSIPIEGKLKGIKTYLPSMQQCNMNLPEECPKELETVTGAKSIWEYVLDLDKNSKIHLLNARHYETVKVYCCTVARRELAWAQWVEKGMPLTIIDERGVEREHPLNKIIERLDKQLFDYSEQLGLTVLGEYKLARTSTSSPKLTGDKEEQKDDMFE